MPRRGFGSSMPTRRPARRPFASGRCASLAPGRRRPGQAAGGGLQRQGDAAQAGALVALLEQALLRRRRPRTGRRARRRAPAPAWAAPRLADRALQLRERCQRLGLGLLGRAVDRVGERRRRRRRVAAVVEDLLDHDRSYSTATASALTDTVDRASEEAETEALAAFAELQRAIGDDAEPPTPGQGLSYALAGRVDWPAATKQSLLEERDESTRLRRVTLLLQAASRGLALADAAQERARRNGRVRTADELAAELGIDDPKP